MQCSNLSQKPTFLKQSLRSTGCFCGAKGPVRRLGREDPLINFERDCFWKSESVRNYPCSQFHALRCEAGLVP